MTEYATKADLKRDRVKSHVEDYELPGVGLIQITGISRGEFLIAQRNYPDDPRMQERFVLSRAVVIPEGLTEDDVAEWQSASGITEINELALKINSLSGLGKGADKSDLPSV
jgi:hypothetical protein